MRPHCHAGDEAYADQPLGSFWVFANQVACLPCCVRQVKLSSSCSWQCGWACLAILFSLLWALKGARKLALSQMLTAMQTVHVINPSNQTVLKNITSYKGAALSALGALGGSTNKSLTWNDLIFATVRTHVPILSTTCCWQLAKGHQEHDWAEMLL